MRPTSLRLLAGLALLVGAVVYAVVVGSYGDLPLVPLVAPATIAFLGLAELLTATSVRARLQRRPGTTRIDPLIVARLVALAKASSVGGALVLGAYGGILAYTLQELGNPSKAHDAAASGLGVGASLLLLLAALLLERVCRVPGPPDDDNEPPQREWDPLADWHHDDRAR